MNISFDTALPLPGIYRTKDAPVCKMTYVHGHALQQCLNKKFKQQCFSKMLKTLAEYWLRKLQYIHIKEYCAALREERGDILYGWMQIVSKINR